MVELMINYNFATAEAAQPSLLSPYTQFPTWMYTDSPAKILKLTHTIVPTLVNHNDYRAAARLGAT